VSKGPGVERLLGSAVEAIGGSTRLGQVQMAAAVESAIGSGEHLLVQAGTGTGKSLAYLVPALVHAVETGKPVVVSTATLALQAQVIDRDLPRLAAAVAPLLGRRPTYALVKGRRNYLCKHKLVGGFPAEEDVLFEAPSDQVAPGRLGAEVIRLRDWSEETQTGDRDELVPGVTERAWRQVSVSAHECLGSKCPLAQECFVENARADSRMVDVVVTNHALLAIDAFGDPTLLPEHDTVVIDEGHELVDRVTSAITDELTPAMVERAARQSARLVRGKSAEGLQDPHEALAASGAELAAAIEDIVEGRMTAVPAGLTAALARVRDSSRSLLSALKPGRGEEIDGARQVARAGVQEVYDVSDRLLSGNEHDVMWLADEQRRGKVLHVAPITVAGLLREKLFAERTVILTSATLELGGTFESIARSLGLAGPDAPAWTGLDVGSPFDYPKQAMLYVARHLPPPGRDGIGEAQLDELEALVRAAGGRTLGLFSSMRGARTAAEAMRQRLDVPILLQGDDQTATLVRNFARDAHTCLFGTLSLWQGVDVPGPACQLVVIDRLPFPRPDDPLASARSQAVADAGGNGFMTVSATHAALRLAQGSGRLIRSSADRGVVAVLDSRLASARYAGFLRASLPPYWPTADRSLVLAALGRLDEAAGEAVWPVEEPGSRAAGKAQSAAGTRGSAAKVAEVVELVALGESVQPEPTPAADSARTAVTLGHAWTSEQDEELRDGVDIGATVHELAEQLELPPEMVVARLAGLGLSLDLAEDTEDTEDTKDTESAEV
jgi:ATP-dependent DNA helicase DinG